MVKRGDDLAGIIHQALIQSDHQIESGDVVAIAQKVVSKAEGRIVDLNTVMPSQEAIQLGRETGKDARLVELILSESTEVIRCRPGLIIVEHQSGIILANAGIDQSNTGKNDSQELVTLLPEDSNASARQIRHDLETLLGKRLGVIITDSVGRPWRKGTVGIALGSAGILALRDLRGEKDLFGKILEVSETADADSLAAVACLLMGEGDDSNPVVLLRGHGLDQGEHDTDDLLRPKSEDLFR